MFKKALNCLKIIFILLLVGGFLFFSNDFEKKVVLAKEEGQSDAIAIRVLPNANHYGPMLWYQKQGFAGSPTSLEVDGYKAVQDGRTVYVNVANGGYCMGDLDRPCVSHSECGRGTCEFYTNIYLISYNQDAGPNTISVFNKILEGWRFNTNLVETGTCFDGATSTVCLADNDCPDGDYCSSLKARLTRDIRRLADVVEMREAVENYNVIYSYYPKLGAGTYLPGKTISTWPSWQTTFSSEIGMTTPLDPINKMGDCGGAQYDPATCWDDQNKTFAGSFPDGLPAGSNVLVYATDDNGSSYELCGFMESGFLVSGEWGACVSGITDNNPPVINCGSLEGIIGEEFVGYVSVTDADGDDLTIEINNLPADFWEEETSNPNQKKIYSPEAPLAADGAVFEVRANDGKAVSETDCTINIEEESFIVYPIPNQRIVLSANLNFVIYANHSKKEYDGMAFYFSGEPSGFSCTRSDFYITEDGRYECTISYFPENSELLGTYQISVYATNGQGDQSTTQTFELEIYNNPPVMNPINCKEYVRKNHDYECKFSATDPDGHDIVYYHVFDKPDGMDYAFLADTQEGMISGQETSTRRYNLSIFARDQFGAISEQIKFSLYVNSYCGDGAEDEPNMESKGGPGNDGYEDCDDGNTTDGDGCNTFSSNCTWTCRDGTVSLAEQCDDGNAADGDACSNSCQWTCKELGKIDLKEPGATADGLVYDINSDPNSAPEEGVPGGTFLKISGVMPTPYIWIANSKRSGVPHNEITKMRAGFSGPPRKCTRSENSVDCYWELGSPDEEIGDVIGIYDVHGLDPSRTAVNAETGDVWIANRGSGDITKLTIDGEHLKTCSTGPAPRGVAIEENGDVWVANSGISTASIGTVVKISGDDTSCEILETVDVGGYPYGLAIDSQNNIWLADRNNPGDGKSPDGKIKMINNNSTSTDYLSVTEYPSGATDFINPYGITIDEDDNVWASYYYVSGSTAGAYKVDADNRALSTYIFYDNVSYHGRGITVDSEGQIWIAMDRHGVTRIFDPSLLVPGGNIPDINGYRGIGYTSVAQEPVGVCGDSGGNVWVVNRWSNTVNVFDSNGSQILEDLTVNRNYSDVENYTYSDMTGINRAKVLRKGIWRNSYDAGEGSDDQRWGDIAWQQEVPPGGNQSIEVELRVYNEGDVEDTDWISSTQWNRLDLIDPLKGGRFLEIKITMRSREKNVTPVLWDLSLDCD